MVGWTPEEDAELVMLREENAALRADIADLERFAWNGREMVALRLLWISFGVVAALSVEFLLRHAP